MRLITSTEQQAQSFADRAFAYLQQAQPDYAANMDRWAEPTQDEQGRWFIPVEASVLGAFNAQEIAQIEPSLAPGAE